VASRKNTYEKQARLSVILAAVGGLGVLASIALLVRNFHDSWVMYNPHGRWLPVLAGALFVGLAAGAIGLFVGLNSAGQRRNPRSQLAWTGFFLSALVIALSLSAGIFFYFTRYAMVTPAPR
jgi:hypothetical protein